MSLVTETFSQLETILQQSFPELAASLNPGLTREAIDTKLQKFSVTLPQNFYALYQWRNGLSSNVDAANLADKSLRQKGRWQQGLSTSVAQIPFKYDDREALVITKFPPLEYALTGHQHLKLGKCPLNLMPIFTLNDGMTQQYCLIQLVEDQSPLFVANGTGIPPNRIDESFLSEQAQFRNLTNFIQFITDCCEQAIAANSATTSEPEDESAIYQVDGKLFSQLYQNGSTVVDKIKE